MTTTETCPYVNLILPEDLFHGPITDWFRASGVDLVAAPHSPSQLPRYGIKPATAQNLASVTAKAELTEREMQVLNGMASGLSNGAIGRELWLSEDTVKTHARRLFRKLEVKDRAEAVAVGFRRGLLR